MGNGYYYFGGFRAMLYLRVASRSIAKMLKS
jgi:hypothetical protein